MTSLDLNTADCGKPPSGPGSLSDPVCSQSGRMPARSTLSPIALMAGYYMRGRLESTVGTPAHGLRVFSERVTEAVEFQGRAPHGCRTVLLLGQGARITVNGLTGGANCIVSVQPGAQVHGYLGAASSLTGLQITQSPPPHRTHPRGNGRLRAGLASVDVTSCDGRSAGEFRRKVTDALRICSAREPSVGEAEALQGLAAGLVAGASGYCAQDASDGAWATVRRAIDYIEKRVRHPICIASASAAMAVSISSLERAFRSVFELTPSRYICGRRLALARQELESPTCTAKIIDVALSAGFTHPSRFSMQYRRRFGELPSATVQRRNRVGMPGPVAHG